MPFTDRLIALVDKACLGAARKRPSDPPGDDNVALAALLVHVARIDGTFDEREARSLRAMLQGRFGLNAAEAADLTERAADLDRETGDVSDLVERMGHSSSPEARRRVLAMAYAVAAADGVIAEFEDDLVWRLGHLLGFDDAAIREVRDLETGDIPAAAAGAVS